VFLDWKRKLSKLQTKQPNLPPFEKNLDFWRQLWKIVELSDVVVQVRFG
jgi:large subunit GTPase 1